MGMKDLFSQGLMCDVTIVAGGKQFDAHKLVLAAGSDFFRNTFAAHRPAADKVMQKERISVTFDFLLPETFAVVLESLYTGTIMVSEHTVSGTVRLAAHLGIQPLRRCLIAYLCQIARPENVEELQSLGQELQSQDLLDAAQDVELCIREAALVAAVSASASVSTSEVKIVLPVTAVAIDGCLSPSPSNSSAGDDALRGGM